MNAPKLVIPILHTRASHVPLIINAQNISSRGGGDWKMEIFGSFNRNANWELNVGKIATLHSIDASSSKKNLPKHFDRVHTFGPTHVVSHAWSQPGIWCQANPHDPFLNYPSFSVCHMCVPILRNFFVIFAEFWPISRWSHPRKINQ